MATPNKVKCSVCNRPLKHAIYPWGEKIPFCRTDWRLYLDWTKKEVRKLRRTKNAISGNSDGAA